VIDDIFSKESDYWGIFKNTKDIYMSDGSISTLLDFERVLDELDLYAFQNWSLGELVEGPTLNRYSTGCIFMWPHNLMPDPRGGKRLLPFGCTVAYKKSTIKTPIEIKTEDDFITGTKYPKMTKKNIWLVEIVIPKELMQDISSGSVEIEGSVIDLEDLDLAYAEDIEQDASFDTMDDDFADELDSQDTDYAEEEGL